MISYRVTNNCRGCNSLDTEECYLLIATRNKGIAHTNSLDIIEIEKIKLLVNYKINSIQLCLLNKPNVLRALLQFESVVLYVDGNLRSS